MKPSLRNTLLTLALFAAFWCVCGIAIVGIGTLENYIGVNALNRFLAIPILGAFVTVVVIGVIWYFCNSGDTILNSPSTLKRAPDTS